MVHGVEFGEYAQRDTLLDVGFLMTILITKTKVDNLIFDSLFKYMFILSFMHEHLIALTFFFKTYVTLSLISLCVANHVHTHSLEFVCVLIHYILAMLLDVQSSCWACTCETSSLCLISWHLWDDYIIVCDFYWLCVFMSNCLLEGFV